MGENFVEADLGFLGSNGFYLTGVYDFKLTSDSMINVYAGPGAQIGVVSYKNANDDLVTGLGLTIVGQIGAEYEIPTAPLNVSLDWRPSFSLTQGGFGWTSFALGLRYRF